MFYWTRLDNDRYYQVVGSDTESQQPDLGERLIAAAVEVFNERGYDRATVAEIARRAGVTTGAIYSRYRGKADLMADAIASTLGDQIERLLPEAPSGGAALLGSLGTHLLDDRGGLEWLLMEAIVATRRDPELAEMIRRQLEDESRRIGKLFQQAKDDGHADPELSISAITHLAMSLGMGARVYQLLGMPQPESADWGVVIDLLLKAVEPKDSPTMGEQR